jgi:hypothetical protein
VQILCKLLEHGGPCIIRYDDHEHVPLWSDGYL